LANSLIPTSPSLPNRTFPALSKYACFLPDILPLTFRLPRYFHRILREKSVLFCLGITQIGPVLAELAHLEVFGYFSPLVRPCYFVPEKVIFRNFRF